MSELRGRALSDLAATVTSALIAIGDRLGLYRAMVTAGPVNARQLAALTSTHEAYVREWLNNQAGGGWVTFDALSDTYFLTEEQAAVLVGDGALPTLPGSCQALLTALRGEARVAECFRTGNGVDWSDADTALLDGAEKLFGAGWLSELAGGWIPALDGIQEKLLHGAKIADIGCGLGASTIAMAAAYPRAHLHGFDTHQPALAAARQRARDAGVAERVRFDHASSTDFPGAGYALVTSVQSLHDAADPEGAARHVRQTLDPEGSWMIVEHWASDRVEENFNDLGRLSYGWSTLVSVPASRAHRGPGLGAQAGEARLRNIVAAGGFTRYRLVAATPYSLVLEAKP